MYGFRAMGLKFLLPFPDFNKCLHKKSTLHEECMHEIEDAHVGAKCPHGISSTREAKLAVWGGEQVAPESVKIVILRNEVLIRKMANEIRV